MFNLQGLTVGTIKKLKVQDANDLALRILQAIVISDDLDTTGNETDYGSIPSDTDQDSEHETEGEDANDITIVEPGKIDPPQGTSKQGNIPEPPPKVKVTKPMKIGKEKSEKEICKFFKNGRCNKSATECKFEHPKICYKFNQFGPKKGINKGCDEKCGFFHPNACRNSIKDRTCSFTACRFYHLKGTKTVKKQEQTKQNTQPLNSSWKKDANRKPKFNQVSNKTKEGRNIATSNRFQPLITENEEDSDLESTPKNNQVFQEEDPALAVTLQEIKMS